MRSAGLVGLAAWARRWRAALVVVWVLGGQAWGQPWPGGGGAPGEPGWVTIFEDEGQWRLVMVPPREGLASGSAAQAGQVKPARALARPPTAVAAVGSSGVVVFEERDQRRVLSGRAVPTMGGMWTFEPVDRLETWPAPPGGRLLSFAGWGERAVMLVGAAEGAGRELHTGTLTGWEREELPEGASEREVVRVLGSGARMLAGWDEDGGRAAVWLRAGDEDWREVALAGGALLARAEGVFALGGGGSVVSAARADEAEREAGADELVIRVHRDGRVIEMGRVAALPAWTGTVVDGASPRFVAMWRDPGDASRGREAAFRVVEVSLTTGRVLHDGPPRQVLPVTAGEFRVVAAALVLVTLVALIAALRPGEGADRADLPSGVALAGPGRRLLATALDWLIAAAVSALWFGEEPWMVASGAVLVMPGAAWGAVPGALGLAAVMGTVLEATLAGSAGKLLTGCRVARAQVGEPEGPGVWRALARNVVKWAALPLTMPALVSPGTRHRGELISGTVVVVGVGAQEES